MSQHPNDRSISGPDRFDVDVEHTDGVVFVRPKGDLDLATAPDLRDILRELAKAGASVVLDLAELRFIDSSGLRVIWETDNAARRDGMDLTLTPGPPQIMRVFDVTGLTKRLPFADRN
ncbi:MAG: anti-sigma factor antagonist [Thermoleophilaceae bacterium]|nr:anti-sigma factor antagonist [Thermoleophilaceae bacterium]